MTAIPMFLPVPDITPNKSSPAKPQLIAWTADSPMSPIAFVLGVDLGQARDFSALVINEVNFTTREHCRRTAFERPPGSVTSRETVVTHRLRHIERIPLGTSYPDVVLRICEVMKRLPPMPREPVLVVDSTGVGRPVVDLMRKSGLKPMAVTITAGGTETVETSEARVAKRLLASTVAVALDTGRLHVVAEGEHKDVLRSELSAFRVRVTATQNETFESWREKDHDDLVLAAALAVWAGERMKPRFAVNPNWSPWSNL